MSEQMFVTSKKLQFIEFILNKNKHLDGTWDKALNYKLPAMY